MHDWCCLAGHSKKVGDKQGSRGPGLKPTFEAPSECQLTQLAARRGAPGRLWGSLKTVTMAELGGSAEWSAPQSAKYSS
jgi:hypothetical protein